MWRIHTVIQIHSFPCQIILKGGGCEHSGFGDVHGDHGGRRAVRNNILCGRAVDTHRPGKKTCNQQHLPTTHMLCTRDRPPLLWRWPMQRLRRRTIQSQMLQRLILIMCRIIRYSDVDVNIPAAKTTVINTRTMALSSPSRKPVVLAAMMFPVTIVVKIPISFM